jgi:osmotically-inducible protein OsmY
MRPLPGAFAALLAMAAIACGESRQEKFERALRVAESAQEAVASARDEVAQREAAYEKATAAARAAEEDLADATRKLDAAQASLDGARAEVAKWADDASVFRVVQQRLLESDELADGAVSARVEQGVAVLEGQVAEDADRERAIEIARETPGVVAVQSRLTVAASRAPPPPVPVEPPPFEPTPPDVASPPESAPLAP